MASIFSLSGQEISAGETATLLQGARYALASMGPGNREQNVGELPVSGMRRGFFSVIPENWQMTGSPNSWLTIYPKNGAELETVA
jgi:hypothetical protein